MKEKQSQLSYEQPIFSFRKPNHIRVLSVMDTDTITQTEFAAELDINRLIEKHVKGGIPFPTAENQYADLSNLPDFQRAMDVVVKSQESWMQLDAKIRRHFGDRVENFLNAVKDPNRVQELTALGVYQKPVQVPPEQANGVPGGTPGSKGEAPPTGGGAKPGTVST